VWRIYLYLAATKPLSFPIRHYQRSLSGWLLQAVLARLLLAFQRLAPAPGYVQGMSTLAAVVLLTFHGGGKAEALEEEDEGTAVRGGRGSAQERRRPMPTPQVTSNPHMPAFRSCFETGDKPLPQRPPKKFR
jgi:hypothetical protein